MLDRLESLDTVDLRTGTLAAGCYSDRWVALFDTQRLTKLRARAVIVASGCIEQPAVFQNNDVPGVMLGSAAQRLMQRYAVKPFERAIVLAANRDAYQVAIDLCAQGVDVAALIDLRPDGESSAVGAQLQTSEVPIYRGFAIYQVETRRGAKGVSGAIVCPLDRRGQPRPQAGLHFACDGIAVSVGWAPDAGLLYQGAARFGYSKAVEQFVPRSLPPGLFAAGGVNGVFLLAPALRRRPSRRMWRRSRILETAPSRLRPLSSIRAHHPVIPTRSLRIPENATSSTSMRTFT